MKIIKEGKPEKEKTHSCYKCKTKFSYTKSDIEFDWRENDSYIRCPKCDAFISVKY